MKKTLILYLFIAGLFLSITGCKNDNKKDDNKDSNNVVIENKDNIQNDIVSDNNADANGEVKVLNTEEFKNKVFDYESNSQWKYNGTTNCIVDFYADWCGPCKMIAPILAELAVEYKGKIVFYKVNIDDNPDVANAFGIESIPYVLFIPAKGDPQNIVGAMDKQGYVDAINKIFYSK